MQTHPVAPPAPQQPAPISDADAVGEWGVVFDIDQPEAVAAEVAQVVDDATEIVVSYPDRAEVLNLCRDLDPLLSAVLLVLGLAHLAAGYMLVKVLVVLNVAGLGAWGGWLVGKELNAPLPGLAVGAVLAAAIAWPAARYAAALCAAVIGGLVGVAIWRSLGLLDAYAPAGGLVGAVFLSMLVFAAFKLGVMAVTSVQGAILLIAGVLGLMLRYDATAELAMRWAGDEPLVLPLTLLVLATVGLVFQHQWNRTPPKPD